MYCRGGRHHGSAECGNFAEGQIHTLQAGNGEDALFASSRCSSRIGYPFLSEYQIVALALVVTRLVMPDIAQSSSSATAAISRDRKITSFVFPFAIPLCGCVHANLDTQRRL